MAVFIEVFRPFMLAIDKIVFSSIFFVYSALFLIEDNTRKIEPIKADNKKYPLYRPFLCLPVFLGMTR